MQPRIEDSASLFSVAGCWESSFAFWHALMLASRRSEDGGAQGWYWAHSCQTLWVFCGVVFFFFFKEGFCCSQMLIIQANTLMLSFLCSLEQGAGEGRDPAAFAHALWGGGEVHPEPRRINLALQIISVASGA